MSVPSVLDGIARLAPQSVAWRIGQEQLTYDEWRDASYRVGAGVEACVAKGAVVGLPAKHADWIRFAVAYVGVQSGGAIPVPMNVALPSAELAKQAQAVGMTAWIDLGGHVAAMPELQRLDYADLVRSAPGFVPQPVERADIVFTSGTTGRSTGVVSTHADLLSGSKLPPSWRNRALWHSMPPFSAAGLHGAFVLALRSGGEARSASNVSVLQVDSLWNQILEPSVAGLYLLPSVASELIRRPGENAEHIKMVMLTGAKTPTATLADLSRRFPGASIVSLYGATEGGQAQVMMVYDPDKPTGLGRAVGRTEVRLRNTMTQKGAGTVGEICLRRRGSPTRSYAGADGGDVFLEGGWTATGDLGSIDADGVLHLFDRVKDVIIRGGQSISAAELEEVLETRPAIREAGVVGAPSRVDDEEIVAFVVAEDAVAGIDVLAIRRELADLLPSSRIPRRFEVVAGLPRNSMGKIDKRELRRHHGLADS